MNTKLTLNIIGTVLVFMSCFMLFPIIVSLIYKQTDTIPLTMTLLITLVSGALFYFLTKKHKKEEIRHRDAFIIVAASWVIVSFFGSIPYILTGTCHSFTDAFFESMAGFTTTGASVLSDIEAIPKGLLFWRSLTQWIGGMGIILFALAVLPLLGTGGMQLFKAEVPEISVDKLRPRIVDMAKSLWFIYVILTATDALLLSASGMNVYDAICHAFTTMATGGFSTKNNSITYFQSSYIEYITCFFMFLAGINYSIYFYVFKGKISRLWKSNEFRFYLTVVGIAAFLITVNGWTISSHSLFDSLRYSLFQVVSLMTTTGYTTYDYQQWSSFAQIILIVIMFFGGMIGSTGGGIKQVRILLMLKQGYREIYQLIHPHAVTSVKLDEKYLDKEILGSIWGLVFLFLGLCVIATIAIAATGIDIISSVTTVISATCNVGPAFGIAGPANNYAAIPYTGKWILIFCMLIGRLEVYTVLILFVPRFWRK